MPSDIPGGGPPDPNLPPPEPGFPSSKVILPNGEALVYYNHGNEIRTERVSLAAFNAGRTGFYERWRNER